MVRHPLGMTASSNLQDLPGRVGCGRQEGDGWEERRASLPMQGRLLGDVTEPVASQ